MKIFFAGYLDAQWMTGWQRCQVLKELGNEVYEFNQHKSWKVSSTQTILKYVTNQFFFDTKKINVFNQIFLNEFIAYKPEVAWIEKSLLLLPETLEKARELFPNCIFICFHVLHFLHFFICFTK